MCLAPIWLINYVRKYVLQWFVFFFFSSGFTSVWANEWWRERCASKNGLVVLQYKVTVIFVCQEDYWKKRWQCIRQLWFPLRLSWLHPLQWFLSILRAGPQNSCRMIPMGVEGAEEDTGEAWRNGGNLPHLHNHPQLHQVCSLFTTPNAYSFKETLGKLDII